MRSRQKVNLKNGTNFFPSNFLIKLVITTNVFGIISFIAYLLCKMLLDNKAAFQALTGIVEVSIRGKHKIVKSECKTKNN